jgi:hypothetical protein
LDLASGREYCVSRKQLSKILAKIIAYNASPLLKGLVLFVVFECVSVSIRLVDVERVFVSIAVKLKP